MTENLDSMAKKVKGKRKSMGLTQKELALIAGTGVRFISDLENAKPTLEIGKVLRILSMLSLDVIVEERGLS